MSIEFRKSGNLDVEDVQAFVVTSANGIEGLVGATQNRDIPLYAVGDKTATAAKQAGFRKILSADGDVDSLATVIRNNATPDAGVLLHAGGARLAGDLQERLQRNGYQYRREILYDARDAESFHSDAIVALNEGTLDGVLLFSPHTAKIFAKIVEQNALSPHLEEVTAWCLSNNVAKEIAGLPFKESYIAPSPTEASLLGLLAVKSAELNTGKKIETDRTGGQSVSDTSKQNNKATDAKASIGQSSPEPAKGVGKSAPTDPKKPLPDALTGKADTAPMPPVRKNKSSAGRIILALFVFFCLGVAAWPVIYPKVSSYLPAQTQLIIQGYLGNPATDQALDGRLAALEQAIKNQPGPADSVNLGPVTATIEENRDLVANLQGQVRELAEKLDQQQGKLSDRLQSEETQSQDLRASLDALREQVLKIQVPATVTPSTTDAAAPLASGPTPEVLASLNGLQNALDQVNTDLSSLRQGLSKAETVTATQKDQLSALSTALQSRIANEVEKTANGDEALVLLALGQLHLQSRTEEPFEGALHQSIAAAPEAFQSDLVALNDVAKSGAKSNTDLIAGFSGIANEITQASRLPSSETWYGKTLHNIASLVKFRRVDDVTGDSVDAIVARAEENLQKNDLAGAVEALKLLDDGPAEVAADWITAADDRILVDQTIDGLLEKITAAAVQKNSADK